MMVDVRKWELAPEKLKPSFEQLPLNFETTKDLECMDGIIGQERAAEAMNFGLGIRAKGYNIYVAGLSGTGRSSYTDSLVRKIASAKFDNKDYVYVFNFKASDQPKSICFKSGEGRPFQEDITEMFNKLCEEIPKTFMSREYEVKSSDLGRKYEQMSDQLLKELNEIARQKNFFFQQGNKGLVSIPLKEDGSMMTDEEYGELTEEDFNRLKDKSQELSSEVSEFMNRMRGLEQELRNRLLELDKKTGERIVAFYMEDVLEKYQDHEKAKGYLEEMKADIIDNIGRFKSSQKAPAGTFTLQKEDPRKFLERYRVNLFIDNSELKTAPIIYESNPSYYNLTGMTEYKNEMGFLTTNFMDIKPGALHKANGGFLILNVRELFTEPFAWEALKRALKTGKLTIENLNKLYGYVVTASLKPEPIDLNLKVILIGDYYTYSILFNYDEDFRKLFRIVADFDTQMQSTDENILKFIRSIATQCEGKGLRHFTRDAVQRILEYSTRLAENRSKLSSRYNILVEILYEADAFCPPQVEFVRREDVQKAIDAKRYRNDMYEQKLNELYDDGTLLLDIDGEKVGQINGLAVMETGEYSFGKPARITASSYKGEAGIINVEREVKRSGATHDKGVLILSGYIGNRYAKDRALSVNTSITFEQNYSGIDGDSASSTELYVILSSIAQIPIRQYIAVTGSLSQKGEIQPIGGVNEKIEGFYDICKMKGLTGKQGVIIPHQNEKNLVLKDEVIEAVRKGEFHIYSIQNIEEGLEILTGSPMKIIDAKVRAQLKKYQETENPADSTSKKKNLESK